MTATISPAKNTVTFSTWVGFAALCVGMFMAVLDIQVVVTSLEVINASLNIGADSMSWIQTAYLTAEVISIPLTGVFIRSFSVRWLFAGAIIVFILASIGCALSYDFLSLIICRILQGFAGGVLIPLVFTAIFLMFPKGTPQVLATTLAGLLAVLAPTLGPLCGGWITENYSWHWLFLINIIPGILTLLAGVLCLPIAEKNLNLLKSLDWLSVLLVAVSLSALLIGLKEAPTQGWLSVPVILCFLLFFGTLAAAVFRPNAAIRFYLLKNVHLAYGCALSFLLGAALYGSVYLLPLFLSVVKMLSPLEIGLITLVTGIAQLASAPIIMYLDRRLNARLLSIIGFAAFGVGLAMSAHETMATTTDDLWWPQVVRGLFVALCILPPVRFALGFIPKDVVPDASGLFNVARNLGGAIGISVVDTIIYSRTPTLTSDLMELIKSSPKQAASLLAMPLDDLPDPDDMTGLVSILDVVQQAATTTAINECWLALCGFTAVAVVVLLAMGPIRPEEQPETSL